MSATFQNLHLNEVDGNKPTNYFEWQLHVSETLYSIVRIIFEMYNIKLYTSPNFMKTE